MKELKGWVEYFVYWMMGEGTEGLGGIFSDFVQSTRYIKQKDTSPLQGFST